MTALQIGGGGSYNQGTYARREMINLYPEMVEDPGRATTVVKKRQGTVSFSTVGTGPIRGMEQLNDTLYVVSGTTLYSVDAVGTETSIGDIPGTSRVGMATNGAATRELLIVNGTVEGYLYDTVNGLVTIADVDFPGGGVAHHLDTYFVINQPDTQEFWISASDDGPSWVSTDFASKEGTPLDLVSLMPNHRDLVLFGKKTMEFWRNTGNADFTFERQEGTFQERGCAARDSVASLDNTVYFLGDDRIVYRIDGQIPARVSNHFIERKLESYGDVSSATAFAFTQDGHYFYVLNINDDTWVYDATFSAQAGKHVWHQRRTGIGSGRWNAENYIHIYNKHLVGDNSTGVIWQIDPDTFTDDGNEIQRRLTLNPVPPTELNVSIPRIELELEAGTAASMVWLEISRDGGSTWENRMERSTGAIGDRDTPVTWKRNGRARGKNWALSFNATDADGGDWIEAYVTHGVGVG